MATLISEDLCVPITTLEALDQWIFAGQGSFLLCFHRRLRLLRNFQVFASEVVHGVLPLCNDVRKDFIDVLVWGHSAVTVVRISCDLASRKDYAGAAVPRASIQLDPLASRPLRVSDRLLYVQLVPRAWTDSLRRFLAVAVTAHSSLVLIEAQAVFGQKHWSLSSQQLKKPSRCLTLSAHLIFGNGSTIYIASGSSFGRILVWSYGWRSGGRADTLRANLKTNVALHYDLSAHCGAVFDVQFCERLCEGDWLGGRYWLLASCGDDRKVCLSDVSNLYSASGVPVKGVPVEGDLFNMTDESSESRRVTTCSWSSTPLPARPWRIHFLDRNPQDHKDATFVTIGEDARCIYWEISASQQSYGVGDQPNLFTRLIRVRKRHDDGFHRGKNVWAGARLQDATAKFFFTGGADGRIVQRRSQRYVFPLHANARDLLGISGQIRTCTLTGGRTALLSSGTGDLYQSTYDWETGLASRGCEPGIALDLTGQKQTVMTAEPMSRLVFIGHVSTGFITYYNSSTGCPQHVSKGLESLPRLSSLFSQSIDQHQICLLAVSNAQNAAIMFLLQAVDDASTCLIHCKASISLPKGFVTSALHLYLGNQQTVLTLGSRGGALLICKVNRLAFQCPPLDGATTIQKYAMHPGVYKSVITGIEYLPSPVAGKLMWTLTVFRDGTYTAISIERDSLMVQVAHCLTLPDACIIHRIFTAATPERTIAAICSKGDHFSVVDLRIGNTLHNWTQDANRPWDFANETQSESADHSLGKSLSDYDDTNSNAFPNNGSPTSLATFARVNNGGLTIHNDDFPDHHVLKEGFHGRDVKAVTAFPIRCSNGSFLLATGAEDNNICLLRYSPDAVRSVNPVGSSHSGRLRVLHWLRKHKAGIQELRFSEDGSLLFSSGGSGQFFVWQISWDVPMFEIGTVVQGACPALPIKVAMTGELRITSFEVERMESEEHAWIIAMGYSDSSVRIWSYESPHQLDGRKTQPIWLLLSEGEYSDRCITRCSIVHLGRLRYILTAATDGMLAIWPHHHQATSPHPPISDHHINTLSRSKIHQTSILSLHYAPLHENSLFILTTGDDGALCLSLLTHDPPTAADALGVAIAPRITHTTRLTNAHRAAAITASALLPAPSYHAHAGAGNGASDRFVAVTAGNDQFVRVWLVRVGVEGAARRSPQGEGGGEEIQVERLAQARTQVADVSCLAVLPAGESGLDDVENWEWRVVVCGVGIEVLRFGSSSRFMS